MNKQEALAQSTVVLTVFAIVAEPFTHCATREGSEVLQGCSFRGGSGNDDGVLHRIVLLESLDELRNSGTLLANSDVDTIEFLLLILTLVPALLVENGVDGNCSFASLTVTDDELTLAATNGHHGVDGLNASHHGLVHRATRKNAGRLQRGTAAFGSLDWAFAIDGIAERIDDTTKERGTDWYVDDLTSALDGVTFLDETVVTEDRDTDIVGLQVQAHSTNTRGKLHHFLRWIRQPQDFSDYLGVALKEITLTLHVLKTPDASNTVTDACGTQT